MKFISSLAFLAMVSACFAETVNVRWPANPANQQVSSYTVFVATNGTSNPGVIGTSPTTNFSTTLPPGAQYFFSIKANNLAGSSPSSASASTPSLPTAPSTPVVTSTDSSATVTWLANPPEQQVLNYGVYVATNGTSNPVLLATVPTTSYTTPLNSGFQYFFTIRAINMAGQGPASSSSSTPAAPTAPSTPIVETGP